MDATLIKSFCGQLDELLAAVAELLGKSSHGSAEWHCLITRQLAAIQRISGNHLTYAARAQEIVQESANFRGRCEALSGVTKALRDDLDADYMQSITELIHGDVFSDFLVMARHLLDEGYKDAAAVIAGSALEAHLRALCEKNGIPTEVGWA